MAGTSGSVSAPSQDVEYEVLCDDEGPFLRRYSGPGDAAVDTGLDGVTPYTPVGAVVRCAAPEPEPGPVITSTLARQTGAGTVTVAAGARSVTVAAAEGEPTVAIGGAAAVPVPAGTSLSWGVDAGGAAGEALADEFVVTAAAGDDVLVTSTRA